MDVNSILNGLMGSSVGKAGQQVAQQARAGGMPTGLVGGAAAGGLVALMMSNKKARKMTKKAVTYGGLAAVGGLAYKAWRDHRNSAPLPPRTAPGGPSTSVPAAGAVGQLEAPPSGSIFDLAQPQPAPSGQDMRLVVVCAMISAAKSDGHIDGVERSRIEQQIQDLGIGQEEQSFLVDQLNAPSDPIAIARLATGAEQGAEVYVASRMAVDVDTEEERRYLERLADALHLPDDLRRRLDAEVDAQAV